MSLEYHKSLSKTVLLLLSHEVKDWRNDVGAMRLRVILMSHVLLGRRELGKADRETPFRGRYLLIFHCWSTTSRPTPSPLSTTDFCYQHKFLVIIHQKRKDYGNMFKSFRVHAVNLPASASFELPPGVPKTLLTVCGHAFLIQGVEKTAS